MTSFDGVNARPVIFCGVSVVVQGLSIGAAANFVGVTDAIAIGVEQAVSRAVVSRLREGAAAVVDDGRRIVVAGILVQATAGKTREEVTRPIVHVGCGVVVARPHDGATRNFARPVVQGGGRVKVGCGSIRASVTRRKVGARGSQSGGRVEVARIRIHAPGARHVFTGSVAVICVGIEVARRWVRASKDEARQEVA